MNSQELVTKSGKSVGLWYCEKCGLVNRDREFVDRCCICRYCETFYDRKSEYTGCHSRCWHEDRRKRQLADLDSAELVTDYEGPLYSIDGWGRDGFLFDDPVEVILDSIENLDDFPEFLFCCNPVPFRGFDVGEIVERCADDFYEDAADDITVPKSLVAAIEEFNELNKHLTAWEPDRSRKVKIQMPEDTGAQC